MITLYHYIHCPFCIRVRMALGHLNLEFSSQPLPYHDEKTPLELTGVKMLPILKKDEKVLNESLDIIAELDKKNLLALHLLESKSTEVEELLSQLGSPIHNLCMPYWAYSKEFSKEARDYFIHKKSQKRGPFHKLIQNKKIYLEELAPLLEKLESKINPFFDNSSELTILDIMIASHIWGLYIFPEFQFSPKLHNYLQMVGEKCRFDYHKDFWID